MKKILFLLFVLPCFVQAQTDVYTIYGTGIQSFYNEEYKEAIIQFDAAIATKNDFMLAYYYKGFSLLKLNLSEEAIQQFTIAIQLDSTFKDAYKNRAEAYKLLNRYDLAAAEYEFLITESPNYYQFYKDLGLCYYYLRQYELADLAYQKYLEEAIDDYETHFKRGLANYYANNFKQAILDFTQVITINPKYISALDMRGLSYQKYNMIDQACEDWNTATKNGYTISKENLVKYCITEK